MFLLSDLYAYISDSKRVSPAYMEALAKDFYFVYLINTVLIILSVHAWLASAARFALARLPRLAPPAMPASAASPNPLSCALLRRGYTLIVSAVVFAGWLLAGFSNTQNIWSNVVGTQVPMLQLLKMDRSVLCWESNTHTVILAASICAFLQYPNSFVAVTAW